MKSNLTQTVGKVLVAFSFLFVLSTSSYAQSDEKFSLDVTLNSDQFFGFYPFFTGSYAVSSTLDFTFYGIQWSGGTGGAWGNWTEFGVGVSVDIAEGISFNPQIGILGGNLLSSGAGGASVLGDGFVPNLTIGIDRAKTEGELYAGFYAPGRNKAPEGGTTLSFLHYWANFGYKVSPFFSVGGHYEHLINTGGSNVESATDTYQWLGPMCSLQIQMVVLWFVLPSVLTL
ncbi:hypothetical protein A3SI_01571 [Nitritalea halalkaliphila LW7]|uniref:Outer membrane protein beta-barrel domain-containing protein n=1 Tax=Nitritalea halalkaliphila LW7 TaxID=1189621 RepID=I5CA70_9BACT|nr:hypothetical protein A3SI_01571 [Nitritalea halalkaliphila LW7]